MASKPVIVFSHANGFPAGTYRQLVEAAHGPVAKEQGQYQEGREQRRPGLTRRPPAWPCS